jgi:hypothetical protein
MGGGFSVNNKDWSKELKQKVPAENKIVLSGNKDCLEITLRKAALTHGNMQDNDSAFEAWTLAIMAACGIAQAKIDCEVPDQAARDESKHYQRALYRLQRFSELMSGKIRVTPDYLFDDLKIHHSIRPTLNIALGKDTSGNRSVPGSESEIEKEFKRKGTTSRKRLMSAFGLKKLDRQFPVGLFKGEPKKGEEIFTGGKSAIDLIGTDRNHGLWLFELKNRENVAVGGLSELIFYSAVLRDTQGEKPTFNFSIMSPGARAEVVPEDVRNARYIHARLLVGKNHPLLTDDVFRQGGQSIMGASISLPIRPRIG